jgi:hypothetical protein
MVWKCKNILYSEIVFEAIFNQHKMRMRCAILSSVSCSTVQYFSRYIKTELLLENVLNLNAYFDFLYKFCLKYF